MRRRRLRHQSSGAFGAFTRDFVSVRKLRAESGKAREKAEAGEEIDITRKRKPFALPVHAEPAKVEIKLCWTRFDQLLAEQHKRVAETGLDKKTMEEFDAEIAAARRARQERSRVRVSDATRHRCEAAGCAQARQPDPGIRRCHRGGLPRRAAPDDACHRPSAGRRVPGSIARRRPAGQNRFPCGSDTAGPRRFAIHRFGKPPPLPYRHWKRAALSRWGRRGHAEPSAMAGEGGHGVVRRGQRG